MKNKQNNAAPGRLYLVSTPIGNMEDITLRALRVLKDVNLVAAEDTRVARKLFSRYGIKTPLESCFECNEGAKAEAFIGRMREGLNIALISDAGTPGVSDPGFQLSARCIESSIEVVTVPGPSSVISALSLSGFPMDSFCFVGFVPRTPAKRKRFFLAMKAAGVGTCVAFETTRRMKASLSDALSVLGEIPIAVAREMTKVHEEVLRGSISEVIKVIEGRSLKGEAVLVLRLEEEALTPEGATAMMETLLREGLPLKEVVKAVTKEGGLERTEVYKEALAIKVRLGI